MASNGTPQSELYSTGYGALPNQYRDRSAEQSSTNSGNPMSYIPNYFDPMYGTQQPGLGRYMPPMISSQGQPIGGQGGYAYNLPTSFGPYGGSWGSPYSMQGPQSMQGIQMQGGGYGNYPNQNMGYSGYPPTTMNGQPPVQQLGYQQTPVPSMTGLGINTQQPGASNAGMDRLNAMFGGFGGTASPVSGAMGGVNPQPSPYTQGLQTYGSAPVPQGSAWQQAHDYGMANDPRYAAAVAQNAQNRAAWWAQYNARNANPPSVTPVTPVPTLS